MRVDFSGSCLCCCASPHTPQHLAAMELVPKFGMQHRFITCICTIHSTPRDPHASRPSSRPEKQSSHISEEKGKAVEFQLPIPRTAPPPGKFEPGSCLLSDVQQLSALSLKHPHRPTVRVRPAVSTIFPEPLMHRSSTWTTSPSDPVCQSFLRRHQVKGPAAVSRNYRIPKSCFPPAFPSLHCSHKFSSL